LGEEEEEEKRAFFFRGGREGHSFPGKGGLTYLLKEKREKSFTAKDFFA